MAELADVEVRPEVSLTQIPAPTRVAPHAFALSAEVQADHLPQPPGDDEDEPSAAGRFVVLHDPNAPEAWHGTWRIVTFARASLEPELASDPMLGAVGWSWLTDALTDRGVSYEALSGTVTRVVSEGFGQMADQEPTVEVEVRASWTPAVEDLTSHLLTWVELLCHTAGLPPLPEGVRPLPSRRR